MEKLDLKKAYKALYAPRAGRFAVVDVPPLPFLMADGAGDPNTSPAFQAATEALYGLAYACKFAGKAQGHDVVVGPLEGLWWTDDMAEFSMARKGDWLWTLMIAQPPWIDAEMVAAAKAALAAKKELPALDGVRLETYHEGLAVQVLYVGAYDDEPPTIARLHAFAREQGYALSGKHHEIYLSDARRTAPEKLRTILRQPVRPA